MNTRSAEPSWTTDDVRDYRRNVRGFVARSFAPVEARWRAQRSPDRAAWEAAGSASLLLADVPTAYGGGGGTFAHAAVVHEELAAAGVPFGVAVQDVVAHYLVAYGTEAQRERYLPRMARGEVVAAICMSEPSAGSDLGAIRTTARRVDDGYVVNGSKTFVTNGCMADLLCVAVKTAPSTKGFAATSLLLVETSATRGLRKGSALGKLGMHAQDTCEVFFDDVAVPASALLGPKEGMGLLQMMERMPYERLCVAIGALSLAERAVTMTRAHARERVVFGKPLLDLQSVRFTLAECVTTVRVARAFVDTLIADAIAGRLDEAATAMAKYWVTDRAWDVVDACAQLHGGNAYIEEHPMARVWADCRVQRIYAGSNELMKELVARRL